MAEKRTYRWLGLVIACLLASLASSGCVKKSRYDALHGKYDHSRHQANTCGQQLHAQLAAVQGLNYARAQSAQQLAVSHAEKEALQRSVGQLRQRAAHSKAREAEYRRRVARLVSTLDKNAKIFRVNSRRLGGGLSGLGLRKGQKPGNPLRPHLYSSGQGEMDLARSARIQIDGIRFDRLTLGLKDGKLVGYTLSVSRSGDKKVDKLKKLLRSICRKSDRELWRRGRPGPGTPKAGPYGVTKPLVVLNEASCEPKMPPWHLAVYAERAHASDGLNRMDLVLRVRPKKP